jgi:hypothetical protein
MEQIPNRRPGASKYYLVGLAMLASGLIFGWLDQAHAGQCRDPWVTQAVKDVTGHWPNGDYESGECRYTNYGGGQWSSYGDLVNKVRAVLGPKIDLSIQPGSFPIRSIGLQALSRFQSAQSGGYTWYWVQDRWFKLVATGGGNYQLISNDGASIVTNQGANIITNQGANLR